MNHAKRWMPVFHANDDSLNMLIRNHEQSTSISHCLQAKVVFVCKNAWACLHIRKQPERDVRVDAVTNGGQEWIQASDRLVVSVAMVTRLSSENLPGMIDPYLEDDRRIWVSPCFVVELLDFRA